MAKIIEVYSGEGKVFEAFVFFCPACKCGHAFCNRQRTCISTGTDRGMKTLNIPL